MENNHKYKTLIVKYLRGQLNRQETQELLDWLKQDPRNKDYFHKSKREWHSQEHANQHVHEAFHEMQSKIPLNRSLDNQLFTQSESRGIRILKRSAQFAALLIIGLMTGYIADDQFSDQKQQQVQYTKIEADRGERSTVTLPDGSKVWLNSASTLRFADSDFLKNRQVHLVGEAYFKVKESSQAIFTVKTKDYDVQVTGTEFNVMNYEDMKKSETTLVEGSITIKSGNKSLKLTPDQKVTYQNNRLSVQKEDAYPSISWKDGIFYFDQTPFYQLVKRIERRYDVTIHLNTASLRNVKYSGVFKNQETIWEVLEVVKMTTPIEYQKRKDQIIEITHKSNP